MARCAPGHFSIHPEDLDEREMVTTVRTTTDGELNVEFKATIYMEMSAFQELAEKKFKGVYWLSDKPVVLEGSLVGLVGAPMQAHDNAAPQTSAPPAAGDPLIEELDLTPRPEESQAVSQS